MINNQTCDLFKIPYFQFSQMKKYCPEEIPNIKANYKREWNNWKETILQVSRQLGSPFAEPHIEKWCNGWQVRAHFFAYFEYEFNRNSAAILSVILNRRRLQICLDWHCYRADRSQINLQQYNQWLDNFDFARFADFELWRGDESEYNDFLPVKQHSAADLLLRSDEDFWCIGKNKEKAELDQCNVVQFITDTIRELLPLYEKCHR
ncbi:glucose-6-phosphate dehydrogenase-like protein [Pasteurella langaaensis DSM 22999]|uniref:Glucose-6-phosphate dehydrogenase-like protein n=1 Tax=Alitibacter langaaensis DSM 22999 TaxID=1122935 RepID=A0A2U0TCK0_9PAST|nr:HI_0552 family protein [Pasteurella langaaensis]PVX41346.1 glucose-6-phosphate dehydrogenase-like protein [Pasteurella langaaensis DSM 22999]